MKPKDSADYLKTEYALHNRMTTADIFSSLPISRYQHRWIDENERPRKKSIGD